MTTHRVLSAAEADALAAIVLSSSDAVIGKALDGSVTAWNEGAEQLYGHRAQDILGAPIDVLIPADHREEERLRHERAAAGQAETGFRCTRLHADGSLVEVVMSMSPVRDADGDVVGVATISRPVSDKEQADARVASLLEAAPDAMVCVTTDGAISLANAAAVAMFGYPREELLGARVELLLPEALAAAHVAHRAAYVAAPRSRAMGSELQLLARRKDGSTFPVEVSLAPDEVDDETLVIAAVRDVTQQRATEAELNEGAIRLRQLAENVDLVFVLRQIDPPEYLYISPSFERVFGRPATDLVEAPEQVLDMIHPQDRSMFEQTYLADSLAGRDARTEYRIITPLGATRWLRSFSTPVPPARGEPQRLVITTEDITDRVESARALSQAEALARSANEAKNEFLSRMSHELRTPLNAVLGFGQLLELRLAGTEHIQPVRQILHAGRHLLDLINEVLDISRIEAGHLAVSPEPVSVATVVEETVTLMRPLAEQHGVTVRVVPAGDRYVQADRQRVRQIFLNLMSNAIKYNRPGGVVEVSWSADEQSTSIDVVDDGPGIADDLHGRLFTPFDRLGAETTDVEGTGVGLTVTRGLVELMGGELTFSSAPGAGTRFTVSLPSTSGPTLLAATDEDRAGAVQPATGVPGSATLLYIEDNEPNVKVLELVLELRPCWRLIHAGLGRLGIELAAANAPDLILLDLHLPDIGGAEVLHLLRSEPELRDTPVVILSADASPQQIRQLLVAGAARYLTKPVVIADLLQVLDASVPVRRVGIDP